MKIRNIIAVNPVWDAASPIAQSCNTYIVSVLFCPQTFDEVLDLASRGDSENVNLLGKHIKTGHASDVYALAPDDAMVYCFGQAAKGEPGR